MRWRWTVAVVVVGGALAGPATGELGILTVGIGRTINHLDPHLAVGRADRLAREQLYESLIRLDDAFGLEGVLAESWIWQGRERLVVKLRSGVKFHDGTILSSRDVASSIRRLRQSPFGEMKLRTISAVETPDPRTVVISFTEPKDAGVTPLLFVYVVSEGTVAKEGEAERREGKKPLHAVNGTGPFKLVNWQPKHSIVLESHPEWWGQRKGNSPRRIEILEIPDANVLVAATLTQRIDIAVGVPADAQAEMAKVGPLRATASWGDVVVGLRVAGPVHSLALHEFAERHR